MFSKKEGFHDPVHAHIDRTEHRNATCAEEDEEDEDGAESNT